MRTLIPVPLVSVMKRFDCTLNGNDDDDDDDNDDDDDDHGDDDNIIIYLTNYAFQELISFNLCS